MRAEECIDSTLFAKWPVIVILLIAAVILTYLAAQQSSKEQESCAFACGTNLPSKLVKEQGSDEFECYCNGMVKAEGWKEPE